MVITLLTILALCGGGFGQPPSATEVGSIEVYFCEWQPGDALLVSESGALTDEDLVLARSRYVGGVVRSVHRDVVRTGDDQSARVIILIQRPLTSDDAVARLPLPQHGTVVYAQEAEGADGWSAWPVDLGARFDQFVRLQNAREHRASMRYGLDSFGEPEHSGVAVKWRRTTVD
jgi:hypothetical protein